MKFKRSVTILVVVIVALSLPAALYGVLSRHGPGPYRFTSLRGEVVTIYGRGLYRHDSVSVASQAISQDIVTIILGVPLLLFSTVLARRGSLRGRLLLAGTLAYFLYTYASYSFLSMYNELFLVDVALFSASLAAFTLSMMSLDASAVAASVSDKMPVRFIGGFLLTLALIVALMWLGRIVPALLAGTPPPGLEHYTTLVIQVLDLGIVAPLAILSGILVLRREPYGYMLAAVVILKGITMLTAVTAMVIGLLIAGEQVSLAEIVAFPVFNAIGVYSMLLVIRGIREPALTQHSH